MPAHESTPQPPAPLIVRERGAEFFAQARKIAGERFAEAQIHPDGTLRVIVVDLSEQQAASIAAVADSLGIADWVRIDADDPADRDVWERVRADLIRLQNSRPPVLTQYPTPNKVYRRPPYEIHLDAVAESVAAGLDREYGDFLTLYVGALPYPPRESAVAARRPRRSMSADDIPMIDEAEITVALDGPLTISSGDTARYEIVLTNHTDRDIRIHTNGCLTAVVIDGDGAVVGGFSGAQHQPLVIFTAAAGSAVNVPVLVATNSFVSSLGYTVPPGRWFISMTLDLGDGRRLRTPPLEMTIVARVDQ